MRPFWLAMGLGAVAAAFLVGLLCGVDIAGRSDGWDT